MLVKAFLRKGESPKGYDFLILVHCQYFEWPLMQLASIYLYILFTEVCADYFENLGHCNYKLKSKELSV